MLNLKLLNDWNGEYFMKKIIALFALFFIPAGVFAQNFDIEKNKYMIEKKAYTAVQDNTRVVSNVRTSISDNTGFAKMLESAGTNLKSHKDAANHANLHIGILSGKYLGEKKTDAILSLSLLGSGDSPLVGNQQAIGAILKTLNSFYVRGVKNGTATDEEKCELALAVALIAGANFNLPMQGSTVGNTVGALALHSLYQVITNDKEEFNVRRTAILAMAAIENTATVDKISSAITKLVSETGFFTKTFSSADKAFVFDAKTGDLSDTGDSDAALITALILALDTLSESKNKSVSNAAISKLKWYAGLTYNCKHYNQMANYEPKGNKTTYMAALYILGNKGGTAPSGYYMPGSMYLKSKITYHRVYNRGAYVEEENSMKLLPLIETEQNECYTRRAFEDTYKAIAGHALSDRLWSGDEQPPYLPYHFDNCLKQKTDKIMLEITTNLLLGGVDGVVAKVVIKAAAKKLAMQAIGRAMYAAVQGTKRAKILSAASTATATYSERILQGVFNIHSTYGNVKLGADVLKTAAQ